MNNKKIAVVEAERSILRKRTSPIGETIIEMVDIEESSYINYREPNQITAPATIPSEEKKFICKGKHQYREVRNEDTGKVDWICQCSRNAND